MLQNPKEKRADSSESSAADESLEEHKSQIKAPKAGDDTDSASDLEMEKHEHTNFHQMSGLVPESLMVSIDYKKFA
jgi:hypothetical protein